MRITKPHELDYPQRDGQFDGLETRMAVGGGVVETSVTRYVLDDTANDAGSIHAMDDGSPKGKEQMTIEIAVPVLSVSDVARSEVSNIEKLPMPEV